MKNNKKTSILDDFAPWPPRQNRENDEKKPSEKLPRNKSFVDSHEDQIHQDIIEPIFDADGKEEDKDYSKFEEDEREKDDNK